MSTADTSILPDYEPDPHRWQALALVCVAFFMTVLDGTIVTVALPSTRNSLHVSDNTLQWVLIAYTITFGGLLLLGGRAADLLGRRRLFMIGVTIFTAASLACGLANAIGVLIAARAVQGVGAAIVSPAVLSIITTTFEAFSRSTQGAFHQRMGATVTSGAWTLLSGSSRAPPGAGSRRPAPRLTCAKASATTPRQREHERAYRDVDEENPLPQAATSLQTDRFDLLWPAVDTRASRGGYSATQSEGG